MNDTISKVNIMSTRSDENLISPSGIAFKKKKHPLQQNSVFIKNHSERCGSVNPGKKILDFKSQPSLPEVYLHDLCACVINGETLESSENSDRYAGKRKKVALLCVKKRGDLRPQQQMV